MENNPLTVLLLLTILDWFIKCKIYFRMLFLILIEL